MGLIARWRKAQRRRKTLAEEVRIARESGALEKYGNTLSLAVNESYMSYWRSCGGDPSRLSLLKDAGPTMIVRGAIPRSDAVGMSETFSRELRGRKPLSIAGAKSYLIEHTRPYINLAQPLSMFGVSALRLFDGEIGRLIREQYGCEFFVLWCDCYRAKPGRATTSWLWHFDNVPMPALKVLLYLSDTKDTGATTRAVDFKTSQDLRRHGYLGLTPKDRTADLRPLAARWHISLDVHAPEFQAGDAMLFHTNCFHQAAIPVHGFRDVMTFFVLPAQASWREGDLMRIERKPGGFPGSPEMIPGWGNQ